MPVSRFWFNQVDLRFDLVLGDPLSLSLKYPRFKQMGDSRNTVALKGTDRPDRHRALAYSNPGLAKLCSEWSPMLSFVGAHTLHAETWRCTGCKPSWHNWECHQCEMSVPPAWTADRHFNACGQSCPCCRQERGERFGACEECNDLWVLKTVSRDVRLKLRSYMWSGRPVQRRTIF